MDTGLTKEENLEPKSVESSWVLAQKGQNGGIRRKNRKEGRTEGKERRKEKRKEGGKDEEIKERES